LLIIKKLTGWRFSTDLLLYFALSYLPMPFTIACSILSPFPPMQIGFIQEIPVPGTVTFSQQCGERGLA
jgi:hypothetical protein